MCFWFNRLAYDKELEKEKKIAVITPDYSHWITRIPGSILMVPSAFGGIYQTKLQPVNTLGVIDEDKEKLFIIRYNNITHQGTIPEHLRDAFKVNGVFLSPQEYKMLEDYRGNAYEFIKNKIDNAINKNNFVYLHKEKFLINKDMKKEKKEIKKLKEGDEVLFTLSGRPIIEKVTVESIDKKGGFAMLSNRVKVARTLGPDDTYPRLDGQKGEVRPLTEENERVFLAYKAYFSIKRNIELLDKGMRSMKDSKAFDMMIEFDKKLTKIINKYFKEQ